MTEEMTRYYARRAGEYERVYTLPAWQPGIAELRRRVAALFAGRRVFEVACGTGYWTELLAAIASSVQPRTSTKRRWRSRVRGCTRAAT